MCFRRQTFGVHAGFRDARLEVVSLFGTYVAPESLFKITNQATQVSIGGMEAGHFGVKAGKCSGEHQSEPERVIDPIAQIIFVDETLDQTLVEILVARNIEFPDSIKSRFHETD